MQVFVRICLQNGQWIKEKIFIMPISESSWILAINVALDIAQSFAKEAYDVESSSLENYVRICWRNYQNK